MNVSVRRFELRAPDMMSTEKTMKIEIEKYRVKEGKKINLSDYSTSADQKCDRAEVDEKLFPELVSEINILQDKLYAENTRGIIIVFQGMDAAGKDSAVKRVFADTNPAGLKIVSFKAPSAEERDHDFLWRINKGLPERGMIGIFNRSHYEDVVAARLHDLVRTGQLPDEVKNTKDVWGERYEQISNWEKYLRLNGFRMVKIFLHVSKKEQQKRLTERLFNPEKHFKFSLTDLAERKHWDEYQKLYSETLSRTSTDIAPWYVLPADNKWFTRYLIATIVRDALCDMDPKYPPMAPEVKAQLSGIGELMEGIDTAKLAELIQKMGH